MKPELKKVLNLPAVEAAPLLLGWKLCRQTPAGVMELKIVETEAYHQNDSASHSFRGMTAHTAPMFQAGGRLYVYFTYGMHYCLNIVVGAKGAGEAVLLRAGEPLEGIEIMQNKRGGITEIHNLANGPGKLTQALGIKDTALSGKILNPTRKYLTSQGFLSGASKYADIWLEPPLMPLKASDIIASPRIGIREATKMPWRFYIIGNPFVTKHRYNKTNE